MRPIDADALRAQFPEDSEHPLVHFSGIWAAIDKAPTLQINPVEPGSTDHNVSSPVT